MSFKFAIITALSGKVQKRIIKDENHMPIKDPNWSLGISKGYVDDVEVNTLQEFSECLQGLKPNQAITLGLTDLIGRQSLTTKENLENDITYRKNYIARSKDYFHWGTKLFLLLLDHDPEPEKLSLGSEEFWEVLCIVFPELKKIGRVVTVSTSSAIYHRETGECLKPATGHHTYILAKGDVERFLSILEGRLWLAGYGFHKLSKPNRQTGVPSILERSLVDLSVFSPERLIYEAGACFEDDSLFEQRRPDPQVFSGEYINLDYFLDLTEEEKEKIKKLKIASRSKLRRDQEKIVVEHISNEQPTLDKKKIKAIARERISRCEKFTLEPDHILYLADGSELRVADICQTNDGEILKDPQEPDYDGGRLVAKLYFNNGNGWIIHSFAHGGRNFYPLKSAKEEKKDWSKLLNNQSIHIYDKGDRIQTWEKAVSLGCKYIWDSSGTGSGKTHEAGLISVSSLNAKQAVFVSQEHRNPSVQTLEAWKDLESRHDGLTLEKAPDGSEVIRRVKSDGKYVVPPNCIRTKYFATLREKNISDTKSVCRTCPAFDTCKTENHQNGVNYLFQRQEALKSPRMRSHPDSLPNVSDYDDYPNAILIWDEVGESLNNVRNIKIYKSDINQMIIFLLRLHSDLHNKLGDLLLNLIEIIEDPKTGSEYRYGFNHDHIIERLPIPDINPLELQNVLNKNTPLSKSDSTCRYDAQTKYTENDTRFKEEEENVANKTKEDLLKQWLPELIGVLQGQTGAMSIRKEKGKQEYITLTLPCDRHRKIVKQAKATIFLDATLTLNELALKLGCHPEEIFCCKQKEQSIQNLKIIQIKDLGKVSMSRGKIRKEG